MFLCFQIKFVRVTCTSYTSNIFIKSLKMQSKDDKTERQKRANKPKRNLKQNNIRTLLS